uniref:Cell cycle checkpoint protein RAD17-like n=1 Tax=Saccoglossus kowalevskii TaxID=10224 RepID=A0ABM0MQT5_SACKO|nr:PREDICTED: cell cycle checkpoint protein RAD17-like [Saccoglossus kowalevskii]
MSSENFTLFLHQNYLDFYSSIDDVVDASLYLSDADHLTKDWASRSALREYSSCVGARGLVHCNTARSRSGSTSGGGGWKPLHKPQWYEVNRKYRERCLTARHLFSKHCQTPEDLQIQFMPYLALINVPLSTPGQISFLQEVCKFSSSRYPVRTQPEKLNEQDTGEVDDDEDEVSKIESSQNTDIDQSDFQTVVDECSEDELIIEDFDD